jgi:hypothetical protein
VDKDIGDAVGALFGAPFAHDDELRRALNSTGALSGVLQWQNWRGQWLCVIQELIEAMGKATI